MNITTKTNNFQFYEANIKDMVKLETEIEANKCDLETCEPGFFNVYFDVKEEIITAGFKEILTQELEALEDGKVQTVKHHIVEEAHLVIFKNFVVAFGKNKAINSALRLLERLTRYEIKPLFISPERLFKTSEHMAFIKTMDFDRMEHPTVKKLRFDGKMETLSDIAPFHNYTSNMKNVKGVMNTPHGIRTFKISVNGKIQISKKKEEDLDTELFKWVHNFVKTI